MDKSIQDIISRIFVQLEENEAFDAESAQRLAQNLSKVLGKINSIAVEVQPARDPEYKNLKYGTNCAVAFDLIISTDSKYNLVVQISKLGNLGRLYWRKQMWLGGYRFLYEPPKGWPKELVHQILRTINEYGITFLGNAELGEQFESIQNCFSPHEGATVADLLFCFDGVH